MNNKFLRELNVTEDELHYLKNNREAFMFLSERAKTILIRSITFEAMLRLGLSGEWGVVHPCAIACAGETYCLHPNLELPPDDSQIPLDPREPFKHEINGVQLTCCPVFVEQGWLRFRDAAGSTWGVERAAGQVGFAGCYAADVSDGLPTGPRTMDVSAALADHHRPHRPIQIRYICIKRATDL